MTSQDWTELGVAIGALVLMAVAAAIEATSSLASRHRLRRIAEQEGRQRSLQRLLDPHRSLVAALLLVQAVALATAASFLTTLFGRVVGRFEHLGAVAVVGVVYVVFGQALPRALARCRPNRSAEFLLAIGNGLEIIMRPLVRLVEVLSRGIGRMLPTEDDNDLAAGTEEELRALTIDVPDDGVIEPEEREMIDNVLQLEDTHARDIMVPRVDIVAIDEEADPAAILETITAAGHSRIPVYRESVDHIVGILHAKDLLPYVTQDATHLPIADFLRPVLVVPESKRIDDLLKEFQQSRVHIAIVADEYGGTAGLVTIEDILEEIVGDIQDEYDVEEPLLERVGDDVVIVDGRLPLEEIEEALGVLIQGDDTGTVAGFVHRHLEHLPAEGEQFEADGLAVTVLSVEGHRLRQLRISRAGEHPETEEPAADLPQDIEEASA